jgi:RNA polymerase subunit RPABC4/transcription elongation factor Spt4
MGMQYDLVSCTGCGLLFPSTDSVCRNCGAANATGHDEATAIVGWLQSLPVEQRAAAIAAEPVGYWPPTPIRTYPGRTQFDAGALFGREAELLGQAGYQPVAQSWADGRPGIGRVLAIGVFAESLRPNGFLTVTYARRQPAQEAQPQTPSTKKCPDCAETVLAEARLCRHCRHEFWPTG